MTKLKPVKPLCVGWLIPGFFGVWPRNDENKRGIKAVVLRLSDWQRLEKGKR